MALKETRINIDGVLVGTITSTGRYLDRARFRALRPTERLRAYLGLVAPAARNTTVLSRVCHVRINDVGNLLKADLQHGRVVKQARGWYALRKEAWGLEQLQAVPVLGPEEAEHGG